MDHQKLPILQILFMSYQIFFKNFRTFLKLIWFPVLISISSNVLTSFHDLIQNGPFWGEMLSYLYFICIIPPITSWHRLIISDSNIENPRIGFSFKKEEWNYAVKLLIFMIIAFVFLIVASIFVTGLFKALEIIYDFGAEPSIAISIILFFCIAILFLPLSGFMLTLPAAAVGHPLKIGDTRKFAENNISRIWLLYVLALLPQIILSVIFIFVTSSPSGETNSYLISARILFETLINFSLFMITVGVLSLTYIRLVEGRETLNPDTPLK